MRIIPTPFRGVGMSPPLTSIRCWYSTKDLPINFFLRRKKEGLPPQKALFAVAHKLIRVIFAMLSHRTCFKVKEAI